MNGASKAGRAEGGLQMTYRSLLVGVDGSAASARAVERAVDLARVAGAQLVVVGVEEPRPPFAIGPAGWPGPVDLQQAVGAAVARARRAGVGADGMVLAGYPAEVIVRVSAERSCDLVVVGASASTNGSGRTADKVADLATCAVLVAR